MFRSSAVAAIISLAALVAAQVASSSNYDGRYPSYIVEADTTCVSEGSFVHPKNCSWFYRCTDRMNLGFYSKYFFECNPGTVFSETLEVCLQAALVGYPLDKCGGGECRQRKIKPSLTCYPGRPCVGQPHSVQGTCAYYPACALDNDETGDRILRYCYVVSSVNENGKCEADLEVLCAKFGLSIARIKSE